MTPKDLGSPPKTIGFLYSSWGTRTHTKFKLDRTRQSGLIVFTSKISQNHIFFLSVLTQKYLGSAPKTIGFLYSLWGTHTPSLNLIGPGNLDLECLQARRHTHTYIHIHTYIHTHTYIHIHTPCQLHRFLMTKVKESTRGQSMELLISSPNHV